MSESKPRPLEVPEIPKPYREPRVEALRKLVAIVDRLRDPDGCPWDQAQTLETLAPHLIEEAFEVVEAIEDAGELGDADIAEELGDLMMGIILIARTAEQAGRFDLTQVAETVCEKLVRRHPHVFADSDAPDAEAALANWEAVKKEERKAKAVDASALAGVPKAMPALQRAKRTAQKSISAGFRWSSVRGALDKVREELEELDEALNASGALEQERAKLEGQAAARVEEELGDLLIASAFVGAYVGIDPERAARKALRRFDARFRHMETGLGGELAGRPLEQLLAAWELAKTAVAKES